MQQVTQNRDDETKAKSQQALLSLSAPVSGTAQQLATHTLGSVVTTAQPLMETRPDDTAEVEAQLENRDVGFVDVGQTEAVKIKALPYTCYGFQLAVVAVSNDAVQGKKVGLTFPVRIRLTTNLICIDRRWIAPTPGMGMSHSGTG
jgi:hemolysin D